MSEYSTVFGIDSHARSSTVCSLNPSTGESSTRKFPGNDYYAIADWIKSFPQPSYAVYESGCTGFFPVRTLRELGINADVIAVSRLPRSTQDNRMKTDRNDALRIAKAIVSHDAVPVYVPTPEAEALRNLSSAMDDAVGRVQTIKQQILSFLLMHGILWDEKTPLGARRHNWCYDHKQWLEKIKMDSPSLQNTLEYYLTTLDDLESQYKQIEKCAHSAVDVSSLKPVVDSLQLMKGCKFRLALAFASEIEDFSRFKNARSVSSYFGLVPSQHSSGNKQASGPLTKTGHSITRKLAIEGSWSYARATHNTKKIPKDIEVVSEEIRRHANRGSERLRKRRAYLIGQGLNKCKANAATASELVKWLWVIGSMVQNMEK